MNVIVFLAAGFEEVEALTVVDYLRRVKNMTVNTMAIGNSLEVLGAHDIQVKADRHIDDLLKLDLYEAVIIPGGMPGAANLRDDQRVIEIIKEMNEAGKLIAAICAGPIVLEKAKVIDGKKITSYPGMEKEFPNSCYQADAVVKDGNIITSRGPAKAVDFVFEIVNTLVGPKAVDALQKDILYDKK